MQIQLSVMVNLQHVNTMYFVDSLDNAQSYEGSDALSIGRAFPQSKPRVTRFFMIGGMVRFESVWDGLYNVRSTFGEVL